MASPATALRDGQELIAMVRNYMLMVVCEMDNACNALVPTHMNATCYKEGVLVKENHQLCNVTSNQ